MAIKKCEQCGEIKETVEKRRQNTAYVDDELNIIETCLECFEATEEYWAERWRDLYSDIHAGIAAGNLAK